MSNRLIFENAIRCFSDPPKREEYFDLYTERIVLHGYQGVEPGLDSMKAFYRAFWTVFPDAKVAIQEETLVARYVIPEPSTRR
jgi:hypothetical protein